MATQCLAILLLLLVPSILSQSVEFNNFLKTAEVTASKGALELANPLIGHSGKVYACSGKSLLVFERNGTVAWIIPLNYMCNVHITPVDDERGKIYLVAEDRVLKVTPSNIATSESEVDILFGPNSTIGGSGEIIGFAISISYSSLFVTIKNRGLFAILLRGELLWSAGPLLYRFGYRQGCKKNLEDCYFTSAPVVDQCEGTLYVSNTEGQVYSLYIRSPHFRWIQDFSSFDKSMTLVSGNNGLMYVIFPRRASVMALEVSTGNVVWQNDVGPLSTDQSLPVVDSNGWISIGSLDGFLYSFSPTGDMKKLLESSAYDSAIQVSPVLDCSGFGVYVSQTLMDSKTSQTIDNYTYISAMKPIDIVFTLLAPATGTVYWTGKFSGELSSQVSKSDLRHFELNDRILLTFFSSARIGNTLQCYSTRQKISWTCSQVKPKPFDIYTGNEKAILLLVFFQLVIVVLLAFSVRFCCIFWRKKKLQDHGLLRFLEKRRFLHYKKRTLSRMISKLERRTTEDSTANEALTRMSEIVKTKEGVERKLSTCYSLGSDRVISQRGSLLPVYDGKGKSHSFHSSRKESVMVFNAISDSSSSERSNSSYSSDDESRSEDMGSKLKGKEIVEEGPSEFESSSRMFMNSMSIECETKGMEGKRRMWLKRRTFSSTN
ncbi:protein GAMETE EXPRESSED 3 [Asparagus officinalis]|uniref:protein GAMETE EXPRESSED 3 n=1 Tax=Asparagus officinalis TaxID=4686 RepID=UPI00098E680E|nr:protein GAMETE EXPRESSED 3 [Asparagus officinalis]